MNKVPADSIPKADDDQPAPTTWIHVRRRGQSPRKSPNSVVQSCVVGCLKNTEDKASDANLADAEVAFRPQMQASCQTRGSRLNPNADLASFVKRRGRILISDANLAVFAKCDGHAIL